MHVFGHQSTLRCPWKPCEQPARPRPHPKNQWKSMEINENQSKSMEINGNQWKPMKINENQGKSIDFHWFCMTAMVDAASFATAGGASAASGDPEYVPSGPQCRLRLLERSGDHESIGYPRIIAIFLECNRMHTKTYVLYTLKKDKTIYSSLKTFKK